MDYILGDGRKVRIPIEDIERSMKVLNVSKDEAIKIYLEDEGYLINEEQERLEREGKKINNIIHEAKSQKAIDKKKSQEKTQKERCHRENKTKEEIVAALKVFLSNLDIVKIKNLKIENPAKLISFQIGNENFELDLRQKRKGKK